MKTYSHGEPGFCFLPVVVAPCFVQTSDVGWDEGVGGEGGIEGPLGMHMNILYFILYF